MIRRLWLGWLRAAPFKQLRMGDLVSLAAPGVPFLESPQSSIHPLGPLTSSCFQMPFELSFNGCVPTPPSTGRKMGEGRECEKCGGFQNGISMQKIAAKKTALCPTCVIS